jgi:hypothetical protein
LTGTCHREPRTIQQKSGRGPLAGALGSRCRFTTGWCHFTTGWCHFRCHFLSAIALSGRLDSSNGAAFRTLRALGADPERAVERRPAG